MPKIPIQSVDWIVHINEPDSNVNGSPTEIRATEVAGEPAAAASIESLGDTVLLC